MTERARTGLTLWVWVLFWITYAGLLFVEVADSAAQNAPWPVWVAKIGPLLLFLPGMLRDKLRSYIWLCFVSLIYFLALVLRLFAIPGEIWGIAGTVCVVIMFCCAMLYVRLRARSLRA